jgi:hypothetical protein
MRTDERTDMTKLHVTVVFRNFANASKISYCFPTQNCQGGFYDRDYVCLMRGTNVFFKYN